MTEEGKLSPLVEILDGTDDERPLVEIVSHSEQTNPLVELLDEEPDIPLVELVDKEGNVLEGVKKKVVQLLSGGIILEEHTDKGIKVDVGSMCDILEINPELPKDELKKEFRRAIRTFHPDILKQVGVDEEDSHELGWRLIQLKERLGV